MYFILALVAIPTLFFMLAWVVVTVHRLCFAEKPLPYRPGTVLLRRPQEVRAGVAVPVGVREIREDQQRVQAEQHYVRYYYTGGYSHGVPAAWIEDLWRRRN